MKTTVWVLATAGVTILCACSRKTQMRSDFKKHLDKQHVNYKNVQYYNMGYFELERKESSEALLALNGAIRDKKDKFTEMIQIKNHTRGVCDSIAGEVLFIRFEKGPGRLLAFAPDSIGNYTLLPTRTDASGNYLSYAGKEYMLSTFGNPIWLQAKRKNVRNADVDKRKVKGIRLN